MTLDPVRLLRRMVEIESVSGREGELAAFLVDVMSAHGFEARVDEAGNAVGVREGPVSDAPARELLLLGHLDTVPGRVPVRLESGRLYGRGAVDAKGPLAAFVVAASRAELAPGTRVVVAGAVEEETTSRGARHLARCPPPDACVVGEPSGWDAVTLGYKGRLLVEYHNARHSAHTAGPDEGAADEAVAWWHAVREHARAANLGRTRAFDQLQCRLRRIATSSDGLSDRVEAVAGFRLPPDHDAEALLDTVRRLATGADVRELGREAAFVSPRSTPIARPFLSAIRAVGAAPRFKLKTGTSDMNVVGPVWQCPIVAYGPGDSRLDHTPDEHIAIEEYLKAIEVLKNVLSASKEVLSASSVLSAEC